MAQSQLVEAAQAMRKMKQHVEQLARTKRHYESTIKEMSEKLTKAEKANLELRNRKPEKTASDLASEDELAASRKEVCTSQETARVLEHRFSCVMQTSLSAC
jgi:predicted  nucleic acid-binding Zn-ribbon protein